jgi:hypothetical protein
LSTFDQTWEQPLSPGQEEDSNKFHDKQNHELNMILEHMSLQPACSRPPIPIKKGFHHMFNPSGTISPPDSSCAVISAIIDDWHSGFISILAAFPSAGNESRENPAGGDPRRERFPHEEEVRLI